MQRPSDKKRIFKNTIIVNAATVTEKAIFFIINILVARYLRIDFYGEYTTALSYATFFSVFTNIGINQSLVRAINLESHFENEHFTNNLIIKTLLAVAVYIIMVISLIFTNYNSNVIHLTLIFGFVRIGNEYLAAFYALNDAKQQFKVQAVITTLFSTSFLMSTVIIILLKGNYFHFAYARSVLVILFLAIILIHTLKNISLKYNLQTFKNYIKQTIPFSLSVALTNVISRCDIIILSLLHGTTSSGIYNNGIIIFQSLLFIPMNLHRILLPYLYKISFKKNKVKYQFTFDLFSKYLNVLSFLILINILCFADEIILTIFGQKYINSIVVLKIVSLCIPLVFSIAGTIIISLDKQKIFTGIIGISAGLNLILNIILIKYYKIVGAAITAVITYFSLFFFNNLYLSLKGYIKIKESVIIFLKITILTFIIFIINHYLNEYLFFTLRFISINFLFSVFIVIFLIRKDDIRILRETFLK